MENYQEIIGTIAAIFTTSSFLPQAIKVVRTKDTHSISLVMYILFVIGVFMWLIYGVLIGSRPIVIANIITISLSSIILFYKIKEPKEQKE